MKYLLFSILLVGNTLCSFGQSKSAISAFEPSQTFIPDWTFKGSGIAGWQKFGQAEWSVKDGEVVGKVKRNGTGGWLMLDRSYEDVGFRALFRCTGGCEAGILFRITKTGEGMKGILLSIKNDEVAPYQVSLDAQGKELQREKLRPDGGIFYRMAPPPNPGAVPDANRAQPPA
ncbi:MAG: DUF1080 domain-containing protein, partial [Chitinophagaceae bacterium]|nr:DUF1080 domain-containing protein [Chitinophagaceae bacterium]